MARALSRLTWAFVLCIAGSAVCDAAVTTGSECGPEINFFPPGAEDDNLPPSWSQTAQVAAGNTASNELFTIVLTSNRNVPGIDATGPPVLQVLPTHDLFTLGAMPSHACMGYGAASRRLMQADSSHAEASHETHGRRLSQAGITAPARYRVGYNIGKSITSDLGEFKWNRTSPAKIVLDNIAGLPDGYYCMSLKVTVVALSGLMGSFAVPVENMYTTTQVCFYKLDTQPYANVTISTCKTEGFTYNITTPRIVPVTVSPNSTDLLFMPVYQFESDLNRTADGTWPEEGAPAKMEQWIVVDDAKAAGKPVVYTPDSHYPDGYYNVRIETSLATQYPSLLSLGVASGYEKYGGETVPELINALYKVMPNKQWPQGKVVGIQNVYTGFVSLDGPESAIPVNAEFSFNWDFDGFGKQYCWIDGLKYYNDAGQTCRQPLNLNLPNNKNHSLTIIMTDVCDHNMTVQVNYSTWGYKVVQKPATPTAAIDTASLTGGAVYDFTSTGSGSVINRTIGGFSAAGVASVGRLMYLPLLLAVMYAGILGLRV